MKSVSKEHLNLNTAGMNFFNKKAITATGNAPSVSLPKGGGAIRGIGEKFTTNPVTGTGSFQIPIALTPGRSGFSPRLSLTYDSGSGNGPFGSGWDLSVPAITRKTDKGLPKYEDREESDVFILSGAEDLVPVLEYKNGKWQNKRFNLTLDGVNYSIQHYRPRTEGLFARIEQWTNNNSGEIHWRSLSNDNITTIYGKDNRSRIADSDNPGRIFRWLICESFDDKGNAILYEYVPEDSAGIDQSMVHEKNRTNTGRSVNRYLKRIKYGNQPSHLVDPDLSRMHWLFEAVFDYDEGHYIELQADAEGNRYVRAGITKTRDWPARSDPFSTCRAGFEVRTYRLCHRILMFHHFRDELGQEDYLVRSTEFVYNENPILSYLTSVTQSGYVFMGDEKYLKKSLPPIEFSYSCSQIDDKIHTIDEASLENLPIGLDGGQYKWVDLDGEGLSGILTEQASAWFYKSNRGNGRFAPLKQAAVMPKAANLGGGRQQLLDLAGDGQLDLVQLSDPVSGFYERTHDEEWKEFTPFVSCPRIDWKDPNLKFIDLTGDGHTDILLSEDTVFTMYMSLAEQGFAPAEQTAKYLDEEAGPALIFADATQSVYLADLSGDGLTDIVRIRNGEVCCWPNLGYGRFGKKITMDNSPLFDTADQFDQKRIRLADIDGSGTTDIIYLGQKKVSIYYNQAGNSWSPARLIEFFPCVDNLTSVQVADLLGNGTACLVWSSPLPHETAQPMRYIDLMGGQKPHLLTHVKNNMGAETKIRYTTSTKFYLEDKAAGKPWITRLPFPVHVVEQVETYDRISRNRLITRYAYHHGYFDGAEREFRGFGMVEHRDTMEIDTIPADSASNLDEASFVPPVLTRTWYHTGAFINGEKISRQFEKEYYREPAPTGNDFEAKLLPDTLLPDRITLLPENTVPPGITTHARTLSPGEIREACRALKGSILHQEVYALDGSAKSEIPYTVSERSYGIIWLQPREKNRHSVFFVHPSESISYHYERNPADPRISHELILEVDAYGQVHKSALIGYGRLVPDPDLEPSDQVKQTKPRVTFTENRYTNAIDRYNAYRIPIACETRTWELTSLTLAGRIRFSAAQLLQSFAAATEIQYEATPDNTLQKRLIEHNRSLYRKDDLSGPLHLGQMEPLALPYNSYTLAFTPGLLGKIFLDTGRMNAAALSNLLPTEGAYLSSVQLKAASLFPQEDPDGCWWIPANQVFYSPDENHDSAQELVWAREGFFLPHRFRDPFGNTSTVNYDNRDLMVIQTIDPLGNITTAENDYRVMQPRLVTDPNNNRSAAAFDALGMVTGKAVMGKAGENMGDSLEGFEADLDDDTILSHTRDPSFAPHAILKKATTRIVYDIYRYMRTASQENPQPNSVYTLTRITHESELKPNKQTAIRHSFLYSDGFGREIQTKVQAESGEAPLREDNSADPDRPGHLLTENTQPVVGHVEKRWTGTGRIIYNNKGKPFKKYEPFFSSTPLFEEEPEVAQTGVTPVIFYDPLERVIATLHPNHTYEKVIFNPWYQEIWDVNDTVLLDPANDPDIGDFFRRLPEAEYLPTWYASRITLPAGSSGREAAEKTASHGATPALAHLDTLGRIFLRITDNGPDANGADQKYQTRIELDIEGNERLITDARENRVMEYAYSIQGPEERDEDDEEDEGDREDDEEEEKGESRRIYQKGMDGGERWRLCNVAGKVMRAWDSRNHEFRYTYDELQRPLSSRVIGGDGSTPLDHLYERIVYGDYKNMPEQERILRQSSNLIGKPNEHYDTAGRVIFESYDFKGNLLRSTRRLAVDYKNRIDWSVPDTDALLESEIFTSETEYDALNRVTLNRMIRSTTSDGSITMPFYNEATLLDRIEVRKDGVIRPFVKNIDYNAKGQRTAILYGNDITTTYDYDRETYNLIHLQSRKAGNDMLQDLYYTYDPAGNITQIEDKCIPAVFFNSQKIKGICKYTYDPLYRLIGATGREHIGQINYGQQDNWQDISFIKRYNRGDTMSWQQYTQNYCYDEAGNITQMRHIAGSGNWTRAYTYEANNNRLQSTTVGNTTYAYPHHPAHGFITGMPHLQVMEWNFRDDLKAVAKQRRTDGGKPETTYYVYDSEGERVRKVTEMSTGPGESPALKSERIYISGIEIYREYRSGSVNLERETLHVMDDKDRIAMVETRTHGNDGSPAELTRYQLANHLGSACLETDENARVISYEEFHPYGTTSYQAVDSSIRAAAKRYRYTGKERDEESGFNYHGARYYAPWLGRWVSVDPIGIGDGLLGWVSVDSATMFSGSKMLGSHIFNHYQYCSLNPLKRVDPDGNDDVIVKTASLRGRKIRRAIPPLIRSYRRARRIRRGPWLSRRTAHRPLHFRRRQSIINFVYQTLRRKINKIKYSGRPVERIIFIGHGNPGAFMLSEGRRRRRRTIWLTGLDLNHAIGQGPPILRFSRNQSNRGRVLNIYFVACCVFDTRPGGGRALWRARRLRLLNALRRAFPNTTGRVRVRVYQIIRYTISGLRSCMQNFYNYHGRGYLQEPDPVIPNRMINRTLNYMINNRALLIARW